MQAASTAKRQNKHFAAEPSRLGRDATGTGLAPSFKDWRRTQSASGKEPRQKAVISRCAGQENEPIAKERRTCQSSACHSRCHSVRWSPGTSKDADRKMISSSA